MLKKFKQLSKERNTAFKCSLAKISSKSVKFSPEITSACKALGIKEEELAPISLETMLVSKIPFNIAKSKYEQREAKRKGMLELLNNAIWSKGLVVDMNMQEIKTVTIKNSRSKSVNESFRSNKSDIKSNKVNFSFFKLKKFEDVVSEEKRKVERYYKILENRKNVFSEKVSKARQEFRRKSERQSSRINKLQVDIENIVRKT